MFRILIIRLFYQLFFLDYFTFLLRSLFFEFTITSLSGIGDNFITRLSLLNFNSIWLGNTFYFIPSFLLCRNNRFLGIIIWFFNILRLKILKRGPPAESVSKIGHTQQNQVKQLVQNYLKMKMTGLLLESFQDTKILLKD